MKKGMIAAAVVAVLVFAGMSGFAAEPLGWKFEITPYIWYAGMEGDITVKDREVDFDKSASDLVEALDVGGSLLGVIQYNRLLFWGQVDYFALSTDELDVEDQPKGGSLDSDMMLVEFAVGYQLDGFWEGQTFDVLMGMRTMSQENDLKVYGVGTFSSEDDTVDPILVLRPSFPLFPSTIKGLRFNPTLAIGGGGDADLVYELFPQLQYQITDHIAARLGYRTVGYKFSDDNDNELNFRLSGPIAGVGVTF